MKWDGDGGPRHGGMGWDAAAGCTAAVAGAAAGQGKELR